MDRALYDDIADWYDNYLRENVLYSESVLPTLLELTGDVRGQRICDLACGQGWIARELAGRGAQVMGVDLSGRLLLLARRYEEQAPLGITYLQADAQQGDVLALSAFDGCICIWSLADMPELTAVVHTMWQLLRSEGWVVLAVTHPCFETPHSRWVTADDHSVARLVGGYFNEGFWQTQHGGVRSRVGAYHRTLSTYLNTLADAGFVFERMRESMATGERARQVLGNREVPSVLYIRARKS
ncbi:MAG TPA: methyltransferase domain-containing protein [Ktedonobacteraceae bacterium]